MTKRLLELSASILCAALTLGVIFACIQLKHGTDAGIATNNEIRTAVHSLNEIASLQVAQSKRQADATDAASEIGFVLVARGLEAAGVMPSSEASAFVDESLAVTMQLDIVRYAIVTRPERAWLRVHWPKL
jgi:hypothetical protein